MTDINKTKEKEVKKLEDLTKAVVALTKRFQQDSDLAKKKGLIGGSQRLSNTMLGAAKDKLGDMFTLKGAASMMGFNQGGMIMNMLGARHDAKKEAAATKAQEVEKAKLHAENFMKYSAEGKELAKTDPKAALAAGVRNYHEVKAKSEAIDKVRQEIAQADKTGHGSAAKDAHGNTLKTLEGERSTLLNKGSAALAPTKKPKKTKPDAPLSLEQINEHLIQQGDVLNAAVAQTEKQTGPMSDAEKNQLQAGIREGMMEELLNASEEQLDELRKLVRIQQEEATKSAEEKLEDKIAPQTPAGKKVEDSKPGSMVDKMKNVFSNVKDKISNVLDIGKSVLSGGKGMLSTAARFAPVAGQAALVGGAAYAGYQVGDKLVNPLLNKTAQMLTGNKNDTVGSALHSGVQGIKSFFGANDEENMQRISDIALSTSKGPVSKNDREFMKKNKDLIEKNPVAARLWSESKEGTVKRGVAKEISKPATTQRSAAQDQLQAETKRLERATQQNAAGANNTPAAAIVNNTKVNNTTNVSKVAAPVRNFEVSFNRRLDLSYSTATLGVRG